MLIELGEVTAAQLHGAAGRVRRVEGVVRCTPGHSSLYVVFDAAPDPGAIESAVIGAGDEPQSAAGVQHTVPVAFDGADFEEFLVHARLSRPEFFARIGEVSLVARYLGFRGGFAYLDGWPAEWSMPRRPTSRPVRRGSFALAAGVVAFYPIDSPGGWNVLGRTDADLENAIAAGDVLRIRAVDPSSLREVPSSRAEPRQGVPFGEIVAPLAVWTDRPFDDVAAAFANRAVNNEANAPVLECPMAGPRVRFTRDAVVAWCSPDLRLAVEPVRAGDERTFGRVVNGLRGYLAVGDRQCAVEPIPRGDRLVIRALNGPHDVGLTSVECEVTPQLDRVGIRLRPLHPPDIAIPSDLRSIGMQTGTIQLHPDRSLVAMGPDHPVTGGYLQPLTTLTSERWKLAQLMPGDRVRFEVV